MAAMKETMTLTFGDRAENHKGMQILGNAATEGFTLEEMRAAQCWMEARGIATEWIELVPYAQTTEAAPAALLIARGGVAAFAEANAMMDEQRALEKDTKAFMYGRVVNKKARHNLCFSEEAQAPAYDAGKGTVIAFDTVPLLKSVRAQLPEWLGKKAANLQAEGNYYYNEKCGIGWHGDSERRVVVGVRLGRTMPLHFHWFQQGKPIGERVVCELQHGDVYVMSEKAVGFDWKRRLVPTLRHAAGAASFLKL